MHKFLAKKEQIVELLIITIILFFWGGGWGSPFVGPSNFIDEGQFGAWINHMNYGEHLFKDIFIVYGPLSVYPLFILGKLFGPSIFMIREYLALGAVPGFVSLYLISNKLSFTRKIRYLLYLVFLLLPILSMRQGMFMLGLYLLLSSLEKGFLYRFFAGVAIIASLLVSQEYGIFLIILYLIRSFFELLKIKKNVAYIASVGLGIWVAFGLFALFALRDGWLFEYVRDTIDVISSFSGQNVPNGMNFPRLFELSHKPSSLFQIIKIPFDTDRMYYYSLVVYIVSIQYLIVNFIKKKLDSERQHLLYVTLSGLLILPSLLTRPGIANFFGLLWPVVLILFYFINKLINEINGKKGNVIGSYILLLLCFLFIVRTLSLYRPNLAQRAQNILEIPNILNSNNPIERVGVMSLGGSQTRDVIAMKKIVNRYSREGDFIFFYNDQPMYYFLFNRRNPTRFDLPFAANTLSKRYEILDSIRNNKTKLIIIDKKVWAVDGIDNRMRLPELYSYIEKYYKIADVEDKSITVFIRK